METTSIEQDMVLDAISGKRGARAISKELKEVAKRIKRMNDKRAKYPALDGVPNEIVRLARLAAQSHVGVRWLTPMIERHIRNGARVPLRQRRSSARLTIRDRVVYGPIDHAAEREARALDYIREVSTRRYRTGRTLGRWTYETGKVTRRKYAGYRRDERRLSALIESIRAIHRSELIDARTMAIFESVAIDDWQRASDRIKRMADCIEPLGIVGNHPAAIAIQAAFNPPTIGERPSTRAERKARSEARRQARAAATVAQLSRLLAMSGIDPALLADEIQSAASA